MRGKARPFLPLLHMHPLYPSFAAISTAILVSAGPTTAGLAAVLQCRLQVPKQLRRRPSPACLPSPPTTAAPTAIPGFTRPTTAGPDAVLRRPLQVPKQPPSHGTPVVRLQEKI